MAGQAGAGSAWRLSQHLKERRALERAGLYVHMTERRLLLRP